MDQQLALDIMLSGESVFLTGPAGSGKTYVLNKFITMSRKIGKKIAVTATTGIAATHLNGNTVHSWSGIGVRDFLENSFIDRLPKSRKETIEKTDILIIDEISMMHDFRLDMIDEICKKVRKNNLPFGGLQVIFSGDFFQLPPINRENSSVPRFAIYSTSWQELRPVVCYLTEQHRQDDEDLYNVLNFIRDGDGDEEVSQKLIQRLDAQPQEYLTELHTTNVDVDFINNQMLDQIDSEEITYTWTTQGLNNYIENLSKSILAPEQLRLKKDALVMAVKNSSDKKFVNGSLGIVVGFLPGTNYPIVKFKNGNEIAIFPESWELRDGEKKLATIIQLPLRLAWAITIHKSQGMTLDGAVIDLRKAFIEGMGYVALSRVKNLANLYLKGLNHKSLQTSKAARDLDITLRLKSQADFKRFKNLKT